MDGSIAPTLIEEPPGLVEVAEIRLVERGPEEIHVTDFKVRPEVAGGVSRGVEGMEGAVMGVGEEASSGVRVNWMALDRGMWFLGFSRIPGFVPATFTRDIGGKET